MRDGVRGAHHAGDAVLDLVGGGDLLPGGEEHALVELPVLGEQHVRRDEAREVEHVDVVLDCHLVGNLGCIKKFLMA